MVGNFIVIIVFIFPTTRNLVHEAAASLTQGLDAESPVDFHICAGQQRTVEGDILIATVSAVLATGKCLLDNFTRGARH